MSLSLPDDLPDNPMCVKCGIPADVVATDDMNGYCDPHAEEHGICAGNHVHLKNLEP